MAVEPWGVIMRSATTDKSGLCRALQWLCIMTRSGVDVPISLFQQVLPLVIRFSLSVNDLVPFTRALLSALWLRSLGRQELQHTVGALHVYLGRSVVASLRSATPPTDT